jgi:translation initiation factor IF-1
MPPIVEQRRMKEEHIEVEGRVTTVLPGTMFRVELDNKHLVLATVCGKMRKRWVRLTVGDRVKMEMSPYDLDKARIYTTRQISSRAPKVCVRRSAFSMESISDTDRSSLKRCSMPRP